MSLLVLGAAAICFCFFSLADVIAALVVVRILLQFLMQHVGVMLSAEETARDDAAVPDVAVSAAADCGDGGVWVHRVREARVGDGVDDRGRGSAGGNGDICTAENDRAREGSHPTHDDFVVMKGAPGEVVSLRSGSLPHSCAGNRA